MAYRFLLLIVVSWAVVSNVTATDTECQILSSAEECISNFENLFADGCMVLPLSKKTDIAGSNVEIAAVDWLTRETPTKFTSMEGKSIYIDGGSESSCIKDDGAKYGGKRLQYSPLFPIGTLSLHNTATIGWMTMIWLKFANHDKYYGVRVFAQCESDYDLVIGVDILKAFGAIQNFAMGNTIITLPTTSGFLTIHQPSKEKFPIFSTTTYAATPEPIPSLHLFLWVPKRGEYKAIKNWLGVYTYRQLEKRISNEFSRKCLSVLVDIDFAEEGKENLAFPADVPVDKKKKPIPIDQKTKTDYAWYLVDYTFSTRNVKKKFKKVLGLFTMNVVDDNFIVGPRPEPNTDPEDPDFIPNLND